MIPASVCAYGSGIFTLISLKFKTYLRDPHWTKYCIVLNGKIISIQCSPRSKIYKQVIVSSIQLYDNKHGKNKHRITIVGICLQFVLVKSKWTFILFFIIALHLFRIIAFLYIRICFCASSANSKRILNVKRSPRK